MQTFSENCSIINMLVFKVEIDIIYNICKKFIYNSDLNLCNLDLNFFILYKL